MIFNTAISSQKGLVTNNYAGFQDGYIWRLGGRCPAIIPAKIFTILAGLFYIFIVLYWLLLYRWSRCSRTTKPTHQRSFSTMALLWWLLSMYFCGVTVALATQIYQHSDLILSQGVSRVDNFVDCKYNHNSDKWESNNDILYAPSNQLPLWTLGSMVMVVIVHFSVFIINAVTLHQIYKI